jgi:hypothetical protein
MLLITASPTPSSLTEHGLDESAGMSQFVSRGRFHHGELSMSDNIRLLRLLPRTGPNLHCEVIEYAIKEAGSSTCPYEALSYVWGSEDTPASLFISGYQLPITQNLCAALGCLQHSSTPRVLWVDAVCIDQNNESEKQQQIQLMAEIYAKASHVIVWLGPGRPMGRQALYILGKAGESTRFVYFQSAVEKVQTLLDGEWFQRIWVRDNPV